jgi:hypothetical protein
LAKTDLYVLSNYLILGRCASAEHGSLGVSCGMTLTKGELLQHSIAFALRSVRLYGRRLGLTEEARVRVAAEAIRELRKHGEWRELDDPVDGGPAPTHPDD